jgi:hypothetical protein
MKYLKLLLVVGLTLGSASAAARRVTATPPSLQEFKCGVFVTNQSGKVELKVLPTLHVLGMASFALPHDAPSGVSSVFCVRSAIAFAANDFEVLLAGYPFMIYSTDAERIGALEISNGRLQLRMITGEMTVKEGNDGERYLNENQSKFNAK